MCVCVCVCALTEDVTNTHDIIITWLFQYRR